MPEVYCVRAEFGTYTQKFVDGSYAGIGWFANRDLTGIKTREELYPLYREEHPNDTSNIVIGQQVGQVARFLFEIKPGDYIITPAADTEWLHYGVVQDTPFYYDNAADGTPYHQRRKVKWAKERIKRSIFSVPLQNTLRSSLTVFSVSQKDEFFAAIGKNELVSPIAAQTASDPYEVVLNQILTLEAREFEILITQLLAAMGFEGSEHSGKPGDGGVDATGELDVDNLVKVKAYVQAKRYAMGTRISAGTVKGLRQAIPFGGQGAFITTADFRAKAREVALEAGFPRIGLINGRQLVDLLVKHWVNIQDDFKMKLGLKPGLVRASS
jgi:restriction system protein